jgi:tyrosine-protein phosphatase SIW14
MARKVRWALVAAIVVLVAVVPLVYFRYSYAHGKRLREVDPGRVYRSGQMNADGFREAHDLYGIRTVICLRDDDPDPDVSLGFLPGSGTIKESELCHGLDMRFVFIAPDLVSRRAAATRRPEAIERFLEVMDDPASYPVLIHCNAGLNRTGVMVAIYRMEYQHWAMSRAFGDMLDNGFGRSQCTVANDYVKQYVLTYEPEVRQPEARSQKSEVRSQKSEDRSQETEEARNHLEPIAPAECRRQKTRGS